ncbi:hypothetical protein AVEN_87484-1 [Araneus ventricosus]|uniref:Uncharacterized protein n=1 Tax=Araneus ventricosus TaxID=182803 RepID=A0A4Y2E659_ARAVE|nr:hypothetical protein AVEN_87484-1 [Araneus ventricosus]
MSGITPCTGSVCHSPFRNTAFERGVTFLPSSKASLLVLMSCSVMPSEMVLNAAKNVAAFLTAELLNDTLLSEDVTPVNVLFYYHYYYKSPSATSFFAGSMIPIES